MANVDDKVQGVYDIVTNKGVQVMNFEDVRSAAQDIAIDGAQVIPNQTSA